MSIIETVSIDGQQVNIVEYSGPDRYYLADTFGGGFRSVNGVEGFASVAEAKQALEAYFKAEISV